MECGADRSPARPCFSRAAPKGRPPCLGLVGLPEACVWLGLLPLAVYWLTFSPAFFYVDDADPTHPLGFLAQHARMIALQDSVTEAHTYQSVWWQWVLNLRPIWYLYEVTHGAQRGILLLGNPLSMLAGLPALVWCLWAAIARRRADALAMVLCYAAALGLWLASGKPVQFYYHYLLPGVFLAGAACAAARCRLAQGRLMARGQPGLACGRYRTVRMVLADPVRCPTREQRRFRGLDVAG
jgi:dolichyl-phosphate-mannose-protein mannosyltransferase